jgi:uncharacterized protein (TIGR01319 family)
MRPVLLIDFGSTFTKLTAVDSGAPRILGRAQAFTTAATDISIGLNQALNDLNQTCGVLSFERRLACSSAAGGLSMVVCGLVPSLTSKAARLAAFGAGAKVIKTYAYQLTGEDKLGIDLARPDILLLTGGIDGGNSEVILANALTLSRAEGTYPIVIAGNRNATEECQEILEGSGHPVYSAPNVMPEMNCLNTEPVQAIIREIFLDRIIRAKGLSHAALLLDGILMPTPSAVLNALTLLSRGTEKTRGLGELVAVDLGGATTDVYSIAGGDPSLPGVLLRGLPEPYAKRTVEADIGMRYNAPGILEAAGAETLSRLSALPTEEMESMANALRLHPDSLPQTAGEHAFEQALAIAAVNCAMARHAGTLERIYTPMGPVDQQTGKDLTRIEHFIVTGGVLVYTENVEGIIRKALALQGTDTLTPRKVKVLRDRLYILSAMGLMADVDREASLRLMLEFFIEGEAYAVVQ